MAKSDAEKCYGIHSTFNQFVVTIVCNAPLLSSGMALGFSAVALPHMLRPNDVITISSDQGSWIASINNLATPLGCLASGPLIDRFGRKFGLFTLNFPAFVGWLCIGLFPSSLPSIIVGRILTGFASGLSSSSSTVYVSEISTSNLRGLLITGASISISLGITLVYTFGLIFQENWQMVASLCSAFPLISMILILWIMPESPIWLISRNKDEAARLALQRLRVVDNIQEELNELISSAVESRNHSKDSLWNTVKAFSKPEAYKPLVLMNLFFFFQQVTGIFVIIFYAVNVVKEANVTMDPSIVTVLIGITRLVFTVVAAYLSKTIGRRPPAIISGVGMTVALLVLGFNLSWSSAKEETVLHGITNQTVNEVANKTAANISLVPVISILLYIVASTIGFLTLPWSMIGEVFPTKVRGVAGGVTTCIAFVISFVLVKLYPDMILYLGKHVVFFFYGSMAFLGTLFVVFFLPETQGKTLSEIENYFSGKKKERKDTDEEGALNVTKSEIITTPSKTETLQTNSPCQSQG